jgi:hypothetical protein
MGSRPERANSFSAVRAKWRIGPDANGREALEDLLASQDKIIAELSEG